MHLHIFNKRVNEVKDYEKKQKLYLEILEVKYFYSSWSTVMKQFWN